jgi:phosphate starvation-inducible protein PhoH
MPIEGFHGLVHKGAKKKSTSPSTSTSENKSDKETSSTPDSKSSDKKSQVENETTQKEIRLPPSSQTKSVDSGGTEQIRFCHSI